MPAVVQSPGQTPGNTTRKKRKPRKPRTVLSEAFRFMTTALRSASFITAYVACSERSGKRDLQTVMKHLFADQQAATILQIFCICLDKLRQFKGNIAFWGEIDGQGILPNVNKREVREAI